MKAKKENKSNKKCDGRKPNELAKGKVQKEFDPPRGWHKKRNPAALCVGRRGGAVMRGGIKM